MSIITKEGPWINYGLSDVGWNADSGLMDPEAIAAKPFSPCSRQSDWNIIPKDKSDKYEYGG